MIWFGEIGFIPNHAISPTKFMYMIIDCEVSLFRINFYYEIKI